MPAMDPVHLWGVIAIGAFMYCLPSVLAYKWKHNNRGAILATNALLGWTVIGWIVAFIWACTDNLEEEVESPN